MDTEVHSYHSKSKKLIRDALIQLMAEMPFDKITIKDIAEKSGLTRQTFYHNFSSKEEVLSYNIDILFAKYFEFVSQNNIDDVENIIWFYFRFWQENVDFLKLLMENNLTHILLYKYPEYFKKVKGIFMNNKNMTDAECEYIYAFISGAVVNTLTVWVRDGQQLTTRELAALVMQIIKGDFYNDHIPKVYMDAIKKHTDTKNTV